jgi:hypothetical protein
MKLLPKKVSVDDIVKEIGPNCIKLSTGALQAKMANKRQNPLANKMTSWLLSFKNQKTTDANKGRIIQISGALMRDPSWLD